MERSISDFGIDDKTRFIVLYFDAKLKPSRIADILGRSERTIRDWIKRIEEGKDIRTTAKGRGPKAKVSAVEKKKLLREVKEAPRKVTTRKLEAKHDIGKSTIQRVFEQKGLKYGTITKLPKLTELQKTNRVEHCEEMLEKNAKKLYKTFFADEMGISLEEVSRKKRWHLPGETFEEEKPVKKVKLNCWGAVSAHGSTTLEIFKENLTGPQYQSIIEKHACEMKDLYKDQFFILHDNHPTHAFAQTWMDNNNLERIQLPTYSPDLNVIENVWSTLKDRVTHDVPRSETGLIKSLQENWAKLTTIKNLRPYFQSMRNRYVECINKEGERLPY